MKDSTILLSLLWLHVFRGFLKQTFVKSLKSQRSTSVEAGEAKPRICFSKQKRRSFKGRNLRTWAQNNHEKNTLTGPCSLRCSNQTSSNIFVSMFLSTKTYHKCSDVLCILSRPRHARSHVSSSPVAATSPGPKSAGHPGPSTSARLSPELRLQRRLVKSVTGLVNLQIAMENHHV